MTTDTSTQTGTVGLYASDATTEEQRRAFCRSRVPTAVYGLGKMGLPLGAVFAETAGAVHGVDIDPERVGTLNAGENPFENEPGLSAVLADVIEDGRFRATTDGEMAASVARIHVITVPTLVDDAEKPDLSYLRAATRTVASGLKSGDIVLVESTVPPGTCRDVVAPILAEAGTETYGLAFCPERIASGSALRDIRESYPKIVGGIDAESGRVAELVYGELTDNEVIRVSDATTAECVKLFEGVYRDVNIALANELGQLTDELGIDVIEAIDAANTQPYCNIHTPGAGVGGHCIPYYPYFLFDGLESDARLVRTARSVNEGMPQFVVGRLAEELATVGTSIGDATVALLGVTYRPGVPETRESPAIDIADRLRDLGASVLATDPLLEEPPEMPGEFLSLEALESREIDAAILVTAHEAFEEIDWDAFEAERNGASTGVGADAVPATDDTRRDSAERPSGEQPGIVVIDGRQALDLSGTRHRQYTIGKGSE
ncbi:nucleotide sugar dehydrogenase [Halobellus ordinarius]|uniref:nucleotide sugar dehydrogenase n=1 Tax=Halobellus ordinarius TaxID=3075120 RepID=UPI0028806ACA|nr:nucleotide sugar dehydrogenase [Halobellus sp. ZY16]